MNNEDILLHSCGLFDPKECISGRELAEELMSSIPYIPIPRISNIEEMSDEEGAEHDITNLLNCLNNASYLVEILEGKGFKMRTIKQNIDFLIDGVEEWKELQGLRDDSEWRKHEQE